MAPDSSAGQIKKAYYKLAMAHHPDKGGDTAEFQKIGDAYQARPRGWGVIGAQLLGGRWGPSDWLRRRCSRTRRVARSTTWRGGRGSRSKWSTRAPSNPNPNPNPNPNLNPSPNNQP